MLSLFGRGSVKTRAERTGRQTRLARSPRTGFEAVREGEGDTRKPDSFEFSHSLGQKQSMRAAGSPPDAARGVQEVMDYLDKACRRYRLC